MRADRLISLMFLLQSKGRMTCDELAQALAVSPRTIYRDIEALTMAGVPIYTQGGRHGGIYLDEQYRISLTGLGRQEVQALFVSGISGALGDLGLNHAAENAMHKLLGALPLRDRDEAVQMRQRVHFDVSPWFFQRDVSRWMPTLLQATFENRKVWLHYFGADASTSERLIHPYGLVAKAGIWYVVAMLEDSHEMRTFRLSRFIELHLRDDTFDRHPDFDLAQYWHENAHRYEYTKPRYCLRLRVSEANKGVVRFLHEAYGAQIHEPDADGKIPLTLTLSAMQEARMVVMALGNMVEIIDPPDLRDEIRHWIAHLRDYYGE